MMIFDNNLQSVFIDYCSISKRGIVMSNPCLIVKKDMFTVTHGLRFYRKECAFTVKLKNN